MGLDFSQVVRAVEVVFTFFLIGLLGYFLAKRGWFSAEGKELLAKLVTTVALPVYLLYNINTTLTIEMLSQFSWGLAVPFMAILLSMVICYPIARLVRVQKGRRGLFAICCSFSNTIYIGLPVNVALFGAEALPYVLLYFFANTTLFWTLGCYLLASDAGADANEIFSFKTVKKVFSPPLMGFLAGLVLLLIDVKLPKPIADATLYVGGMTTPLVIISLGATLFAMGLSRIRPTLELSTILVSRFCFAPLLILALCVAFNLPPLMSKVFLIQSSLPVMSNIAIVAAYYKADEEYATVAVSSTIICSIITIPLFMAIVTMVW
ncbi:MAG: AEC family transporter [Planctomycetes bacterium]|nr:AEC family transporter [Planctomycetota bacterium]